MTNQPKRTVWLTGLSGAGKTTLAQALHDALQAQGQACAVLDGDALRTGLCSDLGFSAADRSENIRRTAELSRLLNHVGLVAIVALISPLIADRQKARSIIGSSAMLEVHIATPLAVCEARDPKGLYKRARSGELPSFTGVSAPYEVPPHPELAFDTSSKSVGECVSAMLARLQQG